MSENENIKVKGGNPTWTEHEVLVYILSAMEHSNLKIDFTKAPVPAGRNASGCAQKFGRMKTALRAEIDALQAGEPFVAATVEGTPKKASAPRKRKTKGGDENGDKDGNPKKRGRAKKNAVKAEIQYEELVNCEMMDDDEEMET